MARSVEDLMNAPTREQLDSGEVTARYNHKGNKIEQKDPRCTLNPFHPVRFCRTIRNGLINLYYATYY